MQLFSADTGSYAYSCSDTLRQVSVGVDIADVIPSDGWLQCRECAFEDNANARTEWW